MDDDRISEALQSVPQWRREGDSVTRSVEAPSFLAGIDLVGAVARAAEAADHHPDIDIRWRKVTLRLVTHDAGNAITALDAQLAAGASRLFNGH